MKGKAREIRDMAKTFRKAADIADKIADIAESEHLTEEELEEQLETAIAEFMVQMIKMKKFEDVM